jgi:hypothetical protein
MGAMEYQPRYRLPDRIVVVVIAKPLQRNGCKSH